MAFVRALADVRPTDVGEVGGKAANLGGLIAAGFDVPPGFVVTTDAYAVSVASGGVADAVVAAASDRTPEEAAALASGLFAGLTVDAAVTDAIAQAYRALGESVAVAVRSSATAEDLGGASFAGQQETFLNVHGEAAVVDAVRRCWASGWSARAIDYRSRAGFASGDVAFAVVVQVMVDVASSGVMFTANPDNGRLEQTVINAAWGLGESVVGGTVTPDTVVVEPDAGVVVSRDTADKTVWTRPLAEGTTEEPLPEARRRAPVLSDADAVALARLGQRVEAAFGVPQDIEWARDAAGRFLLVQSRPITALPPRVGDVPTRWPISDPTGMYVRASIVEQLPDPLSSLFADLAPEAVVESIESLFEELAGARVDGVEFPLINGYAFYYYSRAAFAKLLAQTPRFLTLVFGRNGFLRPVDRWRDHSLPAYRAVVGPWEDRDLTAMPADELLAGLKALLLAGCVYYTSVQSVIPVTSTNDILFANAYERLARRPGDPESTTFVVGFDAEPIRADKAAFDLARWASGQPGLPDALRSGAFEGLDAAAASAWQQRLDAYLAEFGHATANLDFMSPVPADDPTPVLAAVRFYLDSDADPHERQRGLAAARLAASDALLARLDPARRALFKKLLRSAQRDAPVREDALAAQGLAWPAMRRICAEFGRRLVAAGVLDAASDVYWLTASELTATDDLRERVAQRQAVWRGQRRASPPQILPEAVWMKWFGSMMPARTDVTADGPIRGTASSGGRVTAVARVIDGPADFATMEPGEVLVAKITTPAFTPLFAPAAAVVTDIGGPLSHSSIVAREYGIPAVLGTGVATQRIRTGDVVTVDGERGIVTVGETAGEPDAALEPARRPGWVAPVAAAGAVVGAVAVVAAVRARRRRR